MASSQNAVWLSKLIAKHVLTLADELPLKPPKSGMPAGFNERDLQKFLTQLAKQLKVSVPKGCPPLLIERTLPDNPGTRIDYALVRAVPPSGTDILATCEVKGPVRKTLFNPSRLQGNFGKKVIKDAQYQLHRTNLYPKAEHYLALLVPFLEIYAEKCSVAQMLANVQSVVPGVRLTECGSELIWLPNGVALSIVMVQVRSASSPTVP